MTLGTEQRDGGGGNPPPSSFGFGEIWCVDFEFQAPAGHRPIPVCMVAHEVRSGRRILMWRDELLALRRAPFDTGPRALFVAYAASAEMGCFLALGWPLPERVLDLYAEHRVETNGRRLATTNSLLGALAHHGIPHIDAAEKESMRELIMSRTSWGDDERASILTYCGSDVSGLLLLLPAMAPTIDLPRALHRGRYSIAAARMEHTGVPVDGEKLDELSSAWKDVQRELVVELDKPFGVYEDLSFREGRFADLLEGMGVAWPTLPTGRLALDKETFKTQTLRHPRLRPLYDLRTMLGVMRLSDIAVGPDGRTRCSFHPFGTSTGRNQPSTKSFIFAPAAWMRGLIRPEPGHALAYIDWKSQEIAVAAGLSGDKRLIADYAAGDPYLAFAKSSRLVPQDATRQSHPHERELSKTLLLGLGYGMGNQALADAMGVSPVEAGDLIDSHRRVYPRYHEWRDAQVAAATLHGVMQSDFGWRMAVSATTKPTTLMNFPMQAGGAEMMRLAAIAATEGGLGVCAPVHDAFLIQCPLQTVDGDVDRMRSMMSRAGEVVTGGLPVDTEVKIVPSPGRYMEPRGEVMWDRIMLALERVRARQRR